MITIRQAESRDRAAIVALALPFIEQPTYARLLGEIDAIEAIHRRITKVFDFGADGVGLLALDESDQVVGCLAMLVTEHDLLDALDAAELCYWVEPDRRATTAAVQLLRAAENWAHDRGVKTLRMFAPLGSKLGRLYERHGYQALETTYLKVLA